MKIASDEKHAEELLIGVSPLEFRLALQAVWQAESLFKPHQPAPHETESAGMSSLDGQRPIRQVESLASPHALAAPELRSDGPPQMKSLRVLDLRPGIRLPWMLDAIVWDKVVFQTGTGFK